MFNTQNKYLSDYRFMLNDNLSAMSWQEKLYSMYTSTNIYASDYCRTPNKQSFLAIT